VPKRRKLIEPRLDAGQLEPPRRPIRAILIQRQPDPPVPALD
jgi:hypothetical protein